MLHADTDPQGYGLEPAAPPTPAIPAPAPPTEPRGTPAVTHSTIANVEYERLHNRRVAEEASFADSVRDAYRVPAIMFAIGVGGVCMITQFTGGGGAVFSYVLSYFGAVPIGVAIYLACCAIWIGFNEPIHLIALNLAAAYAVTDLVYTGLGILPVPGLLVNIIAALTYVGLLSQRLEIDLNDAIIVGLVTFLAKLFVALAIMAALL